MARADLLLKLVKSGASGDKQLFRKAVHSVIAEERLKQHHVLAQQLEEELNKVPLLGLNPTNGFNQLNGQKDQGISNLLDERHPIRNLIDLYLDNNVEEQINEFCKEHYRADLLRSYNLEPRNRILLTGEPGNGKTSLAEAIATTLMVPFFIVRYDGIIGSYLGETASRLRKLFDYVSNRACVVFFDEFDALGKERGDVHETGEIKRVVSSLLIQIDQLPSHVIAIAATNHPELLDRAVWRRFQLQLNLERPDSGMIESYLAKHLHEFQPENLLKNKQLMSKLAGASFSALEAFVLDFRRKYILELPDPDVKKIIQKSIKQLNVKK
jgi:ATP-dependent 26S proteasome regulatory subunit